jgi:hypothetical protein
LWSAMQGPLSDSSYQHVRTLLLEMADLLQNMEAFLTRSAGEGQRLRDMVVKFDEWFKRRLETHSGHQVLLITRSEGGGGLLSTDSGDAHSQPGLQVASYGVPVTRCHHSFSFPTNYFKSGRCPWTFHRRTYLEECIAITRHMAGLMVRNLDKKEHCLDVPSHRASVVSDYHGPECSTEY